MTEDEKIDRLNHLADELFHPQKPTFVGNDFPPFDIRRETFHQSKSEFAKEMKLVNAMLSHLKGIRDALEISPDAPDSLQSEMLTGLQMAVDTAVRQGLRKRKLRGATANDLVAQNFRETGFSENLQGVISDAIFAYKQRLEELQDQEKNFWSAPHRSPDHYARSIASRFARLFFREKGKRPTYGTASAGGHPSTDFGRALETIFEVLEITTGARNVAK